MARSPGADTSPDAIPITVSVSPVCRRPGEIHSPATASPSHEVNPGTTSSICDHHRSWRRYEECWCLIGDELIDGSCTGQATNSMTEDVALM